MFNISTHEFFGQLLLGLINGSFYAVLSLGLAIIFGLLNVINFAHGAQYMLGAFVALLLLQQFGLGYWWALLISPVVVGLGAAVVERLMLRRLYDQDHLYGLLFTFSLVLIIEGFFKNTFGVSGESYDVPELLTGGVNLGFMFLPLYRAWVVVVALSVCILVWFFIERTRLGATLRAATQRPDLVQGLGVNVPLLLTCTYAGGAALAAFAGVLAAPITQVNPLMGSNLLIVVFAVVVIGGMGSILGSILTGVSMGVIEGLTKLIYPEASSVVIFLFMVLVLLVKPAGLFGKQT
jgi:branched-chain amino acid transport system permease protein